MGLCVCAAMPRNGAHPFIWCDGTTCATRDCRLRSLVPDSRDRAGFGMPRPRMACQRTFACVCLWVCVCAYVLVPTQATRPHDTAE